MALRYRYKAKSEAGVSVSGEVEALNTQQAAKLIRQKGLFPTSIVPLRESPFTMITKLRSRISYGDITVFTRQLATMINAGLPLTEALLILRTQAKPALQRIVAQILSDVESGLSLSSSMAKHPDIFSASYIALVKSGEVGGVLDDVLVRLADNMEKEQEFRGKVKGALIYPAIIVTGMIGVALVMMIFVIPRLLSLYDEFGTAIELPFATRVLMFFTGILTKFWPILLLLIGGGLYALQVYRKTPKGKRRIDELILKIPIFGELQRQIIMAELTRSMSLMVGAGVSILEGLGISAEVVGNEVIAEALKDAAKQVEKGFPVAFAFAKHPDAFPYILSQMVAVGEETGKMDEVLGKVSHVFEVESDQKVKALTASIEPIIMVFLGVGVGFLVIAVIMPIYNLTAQL
jgi:type IV pilus assembly protein PilC